MSPSLAGLMRTSLSSSKSMSWDLRWLPAQLQNLDCHCSNCRALIVDIVSIAPARIPKNPARKDMRSAALVNVLPGEFGVASPHRPMNCGSWISRIIRFPRSVTANEQVLRKYVTSKSFENVTSLPSPSL